MTSAGAIYDPQTFQRCTLAGLSTMRGQLIHLRQLRRGYEISATEVQGAQNQMELASAVVFGLQLIKATIDATIGIAGELGGPRFKMISAAYDGLTPLAEMTGKAVAGQPVTISDVAKATVRGITAATSVYKPGIAADVVELHMIPSEIVIDALRKDKDGVLKGVFLDYLGKLTVMSLEHVGRPAAARYVGVAKEIADAGYTIAKSYEEYQQNRDPAYYTEQKRTWQVILLNVQTKIDALELAINRCASELTQQRGGR